MKPKVMEIKLKIINKTQTAQFLTGNADSGCTQQHHKSSVSKGFNPQLFSQQC